MELGFKFQSEIVILDLSKDQVLATLSAISHEGKLDNSRCKCSVMNTDSKITLSFFSDDCISLRASINSYLRIISSIEQIENNIKSISE